nr:hypothetical protein [uncultured Campylobacter sp.]
MTALITHSRYQNNSVIRNYAKLSEKKTVLINVNDTKKKGIGDRRRGESL